MWFESWSSILRVVILASLGYLALIVFLRASGKRTLSKMNAFDFVVTITLGSVFASLIVSDGVSYAEGATALGSLVGLQWIVSWIYVRSAWFEKLVKGKPQLLYWRGEYLDDVLKRERITHEEVQAAMRNSNITRHERAAAILETDGSVTVIDPEEGRNPHALENVRKT